MQTFKQFLMEARMAPLYHRTSMSYFASIADNGFEPKTLHSPKKLLKTTGNYKVEIGGGSWSAKHTLDYVKGISTTRSFKFASSWAEQSGESWVVFEFDQQKLAHRYQLKPIQYFAADYGISRFQGNSHKNEYEEFIITTKNVPLTFVKTVHYFVSPDASRKSRFTNELSDARKKYPHIKFEPIKGSEALD